MMLHVVTAVLGRIRDRLQVAPQFSDVKFVVFTDREEPISGWEIRKPVWSDADPRRTARYHKVMCHLTLPEASSWLWLDGSFSLRDSPVQFFGRFPDQDLLYFKHRQRSCVYAELRACVDRKKDDLDTMRSQLVRYRQLGFPENAGLAETGVLFRRNCSATVRFNELWWEEIEIGSYRDQLSFPFVLKHSSIASAVIPGTVYENPLTKFKPHR